MKSLVSALSLIAALASGVALVACQFVAGINDEEKGTTSTTSTASTTSSTGTSSSTCPMKDGALAFNCDADGCDDYCNSYINEPCGAYTGRAECCAICRTFDTTTDQIGNTASCRTKELTKNYSGRCTAAGPYSSPAGTAVIYTCGDATTNFTTSFEAICGGPTLPSPANVSAATSGLLLAAQARYWGCEADATCICGKLISGDAVADCKTDCSTGCAASPQP